MGNRRENNLAITPHLPRTPDAGDRTGLRWRGCHNSAASFYSCAAGFPPSLWRAVRKYLYAPAPSSRRMCHHPGHRAVDRSETACPSPPGCSIFAASCTRSCAGYVPVLPCIQLSKISEGKIPFLIAMTKTGDLSCLYCDLFEKNILPYRFTEATDSASSLQAQ